MIATLPAQGRTQGGVGLGLNLPLSLIFYKNFNTCAKEIVFTYVLLVIFVDIMQIPRN